MSVGCRLQRCRVVQARPLRVCMVGCRGVLLLALLSGVLLVGRLRLLLGAAR